jgi:hypothetical protein
MGSNGRRKWQAKLWAWLGASVGTVRWTSGPHTVFDFSYLSKIGSTLKIQNGCLILLQNFPVLACGSLGIF